MYVGSQVPFLDIASQNASKNSTLGLLFLLPKKREKYVYFYYEYFSCFKMNLSDLLYYFRIDLLDQK